MKRLRTLALTLAFSLLTATPTAFVILTPLTTGCATTQQEKLTQVRLLSYTAASIGTLEALKQKPEWRPAFTLAYKALDGLIASGKVDGASLRVIIAQLPVKELTSPEARIAIEEATTLFDVAVGNKLNIEAQPYALSAATGMRDGLKVGLGL